jgi:hypothetical protein
MIAIMMILPRDATNGGAAVVDKVFTALSLNDDD